MALLPVINYGLSLDQTRMQLLTILPVLDCSTMEQTLNNYNQSWFRQAADTPFGHGNLFNLVGFEGLTEEADAILHGDCIDYMHGR